MLLIPARGDIVVACVFLAVLPDFLASQPVDTVRVGSPSLSGARPEFGTTRVESFVRTDGADAPTSTTTQRATPGTWRDVEVFVIETEHLGEDAEVTQSTIVVRAADFSLLHHRVKAESDSAAVSSTDGSLTGWVVLPGEPVKLLDQALTHRVFPIEGQIPWLFPLLPLSEGYRAAVPHFSEWAGAEEWSSVNVVGSERIEHEGVVIDCWRVDGGELFPGYGITYWVDKANRRILQGVARGAGGGPEYWSRLTHFEPAI